MKNLLILVASVILFGACQESLEDRAAQELKEYTQKNCPTPVVQSQQTDSAVFETNTRTIHYYYRLHDKLDNADIISNHKKEIRLALLRDLKGNTRSKAYKDAGFAFEYTYRSASDPSKVLFEVTFTKKDYK